MMMRAAMGLALGMIALPLAGASAAELPQACAVASHLAVSDFPLPQVSKAIQKKHLDVLVIGAGSSTLPAGADGKTDGRSAYPARLQSALTAQLPGVAVKVSTDVKPRRTAGEMLRGFKPLLAAKPAVVIWQTGTVDAMRGVDPDSFSTTLDQGIAAIHAAGADVILMNAQYSPRTESMIALGSYQENIRWIAVRREVPVFDRFGIMQFWAGQSTFDFYSTTKTLDIAQHVHDCIGRLLAELVIEASKPDKPARPPQPGGG